MDLLNFFNKFDEYHEANKNLIYSFFNPIFLKTMNQNNDKDNDIKNKQVH